MSLLPSFFVPPEIEKARGLLRDALAYPSADIALAKCRQAGEWMCRAIVERESGEKIDTATIDELIARVTKLKKDGALLVPRLVATELRVIQLYGNLGSHSQDERSLAGPSQAQACLSALGVVEDWFEEGYLQYRRVTAEVENLEQARKARQRGDGSDSKRIRQVRRLQQQLDPESPDATMLVAGKLARRIAESRLRGEGIATKKGASIDELVQQLERAEQRRRGACTVSVANDLRLLDACERHARATPGDDDHDPRDVEKCIETAARLADWFEEEMTPWTAHAWKMVVVTLALATAALVALAMYGQGSLARSAKAVLGDLVGR